jgi:hypothetical protein
MSRLRSSSFLSHYYLGKYGGKYGAYGYPFSAYPYSGAAAAYPYSGAAAAYPYSAAAAYPYHHSAYPFSYYGSGPLRILPYLSGPIPTLFVAAPSGSYGASAAEADWTDVRLSGAADEGYLCETASEANKVIAEFVLEKWAHFPNIQIIFSGLASDSDNVWEFKDGSVMPFSQLGNTVNGRKTPLILEVYSTSPNTAKWNAKVAEFNAKSEKSKIVLTAGTSVKGGLWGTSALGWGGLRGYPYLYGENVASPSSSDYPYFGWTPLATKLSSAAAELKEKLAKIPSPTPIATVVAAPVPVPEPANSAISAAEKSASDAEAAAAYVADLAKQAAEHLESAKALAAKAQAEKQAEADRKAKIEAMRLEEELRVAREKAIADARAAAEEAWKAEVDARNAAIAKAHQDRLDAIKKAEAMRAAELAAAAAAAAAAEEARRAAIAEAKAAEEARLAALKAEEEQRVAALKAAEEARVNALKAAEEARLEAIAEAEKARLGAIKKLGPYLHHHHRYPYYGYGYGLYGAGYASGYPYSYGYGLPGLVTA